MAQTKKNKDIGKVFPHSLEAEEAVLGCMLINKEAVSKVIQDLDKTSFYSTANSIIFENNIPQYILSSSAL